MVAHTPGTARGVQLFENMVHNAAAPPNGTVQLVSGRVNRRSARAEAPRTATGHALTKGYYPGHSAPASLKPGPLPGTRRMTPIIRGIQPRPH